jgi:hypothetical protein
MLRSHFEVKFTLWLSEQEKLCGYPEFVSRDSPGWSLGTMLLDAVTVQVFTPPSVHTPLFSCGFGCGICMGVLDVILAKAWTSTGTFYLYP